MIKKITSLLTLMLVVATGSVIAFEEPLDPELAFKFDASADGNRIIATWTAADDYYLYKDKIRFESATSGVELGSPDFPRGKMKHGIRPDGTEGEVETYTGTVTITIPVKSGSGEMNLIAHSQGCAEKLGICYPPQKREKNLILAAADNGKSAVSALNNLSEQLGVNNAAGFEEPLPPEQAFSFSATTKDNTLIATWTIAQDYYMYRDKFSFESKNPAIKFTEAELPAGKMKHGIRPDGSEGEVETYVKSVVIKVPFTITDDKLKTLDFVAHGQGCAEKLGICYPPRRIAYSIDLGSGNAVEPAKPASSSAATDEKSSDSFVSDQDKSASILASGSTLEIIIYFFLGGLALAFTACMYPMIPILSSIIVGQGEKVTTTHAFNLSLFYVSSMAFTFGIMGALFAGAAKGVNLQAYFQDPVFLIPFALVFVLLAMSMFGFYTIQMPASLQGRLSEISSQQKGGSFIGVIIMGALSALIIGPCAGPVIIGALAYVAATGSVFLGFLSMFVLGLGLGLPLLVVGITHGKFLPRAGGWMDTVKYAAGVILLSIALLFLERVSFIPTKLIMMLWATLLIVAGIYMGALEQLKEGASGWFKLWKGLGLVLIVYGIIVMLGGLSGARNVNDPLHGSGLLGGSGATHEQAELAFKRIKTKEDLQREIEAAKASGKFIMLDYYADWCTYCKQFEDYVFSNPDVQNLLKDFVLLQADVTKSDENDKGLLDYTGVIAPPSILFWGPDGVEKRKYRIVGAMDAKTFIDHVNKVLQN